MPSPLIVFVCGCPRSGTTWVRDLLLAHPGTEAYAERESGVFVRKKDPLAAIAERLKQAKKPVVVEKTPRHIAFVDQMLQIPDARVVITRRAFVDNWRSYTTRWPKTEMEKFAGLWWFAEGVVGQYTNDRRVMAVPFERLKKTFDAYHSAILDHCGLSAASVPDHLKPRNDETCREERRAPAPIPSISSSATHQPDMTAEYAT